MSSHHGFLEFQLQKGEWGQAAMLDSEQGWRVLERIKEELTDNERCNDFVFTSLRTSKGLNLRTLEQLFGKQKAENIKTWSAPHINNQHLVYSDNILRLTERGVFVSNDIMSDLMHLEEE